MSLVSKTQYRQSDSEGAGMLRGVNGAISRVAMPAVLAVTLAFVGTPALAQSSGQIQALTDRVERLQRELNTLQSQVYRGEAPSGSAAVESADLAPTQAARLELRLSQMQSELRTLTGKLEEQAFRIDRMSSRLDQLVADVDQRLQRLEQGTVPPTAQLPGQAPASGAVAGAAPGTTTTTVVSGAGGTQQLAAPAPSDGGGVRTLGTVDANAVAALRNQPPVESASPSQTAAAGQPYSLPGSTPKEQYDHAFGLLRQANYGEAEQALRSFLDQNPSDPLAGNAKYWLGETYYVRGDYQQAAVTFAEAYQQFPDNNKAPDNLLKLGMSLSAIGSQPDACGTHDELLQRYPDASATILQRARQERERLNCP